MKTRKSHKTQKVFKPTVALDIPLQASDEAFYYSSGGEDAPENRHAWRAMSPGALETLVEKQNKRRNEYKGVRYV